MLRLISILYVWLWRMVDVTMQSPSKTRCQGQDPQSRRQEVEHRGFRQNVWYRGRDSWHPAWTLPLDLCLSGSMSIRLSGHATYHIRALHHMRKCLTGSHKENCIWFGDILARLLQSSVIPMFLHTPRTLRFSSAHRLCVLHVNSVFGSRGFRSASSVIWNSLPLSVNSCSTIHTSKKQL